MCARFKVETQIQALPNPGDVYRAMRLITFRNFSNDTLKLIQFDEQQQTHLIPAKGSVVVMLGPQESLPKIEKAN